MRHYIATGRTCVYPQWTRDQQLAFSAYNMTVLHEVHHITGERAQWAQGKTENLVNDWSRASVLEEPLTQKLTLADLPAFMRHEYGIALDDDLMHDVSTQLEGSDPKHFQYTTGVSRVGKLIDAATPGASPDERIAFTRHLHEGDRRATRTLRLADRLLQARGVDDSALRAHRAPRLARLGASYVSEPSETAAAGLLRMITRVAR